MGELEAITNASQPGTRENITADLRRLGIRPGMVLLVHSSMSAIGWVNGGSVTVIQALMDALSPGGTLVMPAHSADYSDPAEWQNPPVPVEWVETIRRTMPLFDPQRTPTRGMGRVAELFRTWPDVLRSNHPRVSFAATGPHAQEITQDHTLAFSLGEGSPLARLYDLDGFILLLGVGYDRNTSMHLAEYRAPDPPIMTQSVPWLFSGRRGWKTYDDVNFRDDFFPQIGRDFEQVHSVAQGLIRLAPSRLMRQREVVDFTQSWFALTRKREASEGAKDAQTG